MLIVSSSAEITPGSFGVVNCGATLQVPAVLATILATNRVTRADQLMPFLERSRLHIARLLEWTPEQVDIAIAETASTLPQHVLDHPRDYVESFGLRR